MSRMMNACNYDASTTKTNRISLGRVACLAAVGSVLMLNQAIAKDPTEPAVRAVGKQKTTVAAEEAAIPECLTKLKLSAMQTTQAQEIVRKYDAKLAMAWKQFGHKYMTTVRTEVALLATIEDGLTEPQRMTVRDQRRKVAHEEKVAEGTPTKANTATEKPADPVEQAASGVGISLTSEQEEVADATQQKYAGRLRSLNRDIEGIHTRLVSLEADKLVELEKLLTPEQLVELRMHRQTMQSNSKVVLGKSDAAKSE